jgi:hypothetical protein
LFQSDAIGLLSKSVLRNDTLLQALFDIGFYENTTTRTKVRVNYAALNVEEFGSVYEGLLELDAVLIVSDTSVNFLLKKSDARANTGSHYTPDELVQPLIKHSLDHLIEDRLKLKDPEAALLDLKVADIACGSGHILLAAARRIATELATVRTGEDQPSPTAYRSALRDVIRRCIYGVDLNPLAVELCKVAFWLEAHNPGEPLNFLDHHIKCGNAIVGFRTIDEVKNGIPSEAFTTLPGDDKELVAKYKKRNTEVRKIRGQMNLSGNNSLLGTLSVVMEHQRQIVAMSERSTAEIASKQHAYKVFSESEEMAQLRRVASLPVAMFYTPRTSDHADALVTDDMFITYWNGKPVRGSVLENVQSLTERKRFFHWFIEFPEIAERGGFDCILGNPPYLGGKRLSTVFGGEFCHFVLFLYEPIHLSDLVAYFIRQCSQQINSNGFVALITTNSVTDTNVRVDGLSHLAKTDHKINFGIKSLKWPGNANVFVSLFAFCNNGRQVTSWLGTTMVDHISDFLTNESIGQEPRRLLSSSNLMFGGSNPLGSGFYISPEQATQIISAEPKSKDVVRGVINGRDLNNIPNQSPARCIINFRNMSREEATTFRLAYQVVDDHVRPEREKIDPTTAMNRKYRDKWWQFGVLVSSLYERIDALPFYFAAARTTKYLSFSKVPSNVVPVDVYVLGSSSWDDFAVFQSTIHEVWARFFSSSLKSDLRYSPTVCVDTFALPGTVIKSSSPMLALSGETFHEHRKQLMLNLWLGLTDLYNHFHYHDVEASLKTYLTNRNRRDPKGENIPEEHRLAALSYTYESALEDIQQLRQLHVDLDNAVLNAYGWQDLDLGHNFHEVDTLPENDRIRYTISPEARKELLKRLLRLNHERAAEEAASGVGKKPAPKPKATNPAQTGLSFRSVADTPKPKLVSPNVLVSVPEPKPLPPSPPPPVPTDWPADVALRPVKTNDDGSVLYVKVKGSDGNVVVPKATLHWSKQVGDRKLFYVRPVDGSSDRKIVSPPDVVVRWKG